MEFNPEEDPGTGATFMIPPVGIMAGFTLIPIWKVANLKVVEATFLAKKISNSYIVHETCVAF
jgi:hypothetical protein